MGGIHIHSTQKDYSHNTVLFHLLFAGPLTLLPNIWFGIILAAQIKPLAVIVCLTRLSECFRWSPTGAFSSAPSMKLFCSHSLQVCLSSVFTRVMWTARTMVRATGLQALSSRGLFEFYSLLTGSAQGSSIMLLDLCPTCSLQEPLRSSIWIISAIAYKPRQHQMLANSQDKKNKVLIASFTWSEAGVCS